MRRKSFLIISSLALVAAFVMIASCARLRPVTPKEDVVKSDTRPGEILVQLRDKNHLTKLEQSYEVVSVDEETLVYLLKSKKLVGQEEETVAKLKASGDFLIVEPNYVIHMNVVPPRDKEWLKLWSLKNYGQNAPSGIEGVPGADIKALEAWDVTTGSKEVVVAIVDTGIDYNHSDLRENLWVNEAEKNGLRGVDDDGNGYTDDIYGWDFVSDPRTQPYYGQLGDPDPLDDNGHGTHVAGTIGAVGNNGVGVVGINWHVKMMALKFLDAEGSGSSMDQYRALRYAAKMNVDVINASYGGSGKSELILSAIKELEKKGTLLSIAAGNEETNNDVELTYPAGYEADVSNIIVVAATDNRDNLASFSNFGNRTVHIAAPGVAITSTFPEYIAKAKSLAAYQTFSGTSMATPHVTGSAALVLAADPSLKNKPNLLKARLMETTDKLTQLTGKVVSGRLNLAKAVRNERTSPIERNWIEDPYTLSTPRYARELIDKTWVIEKPGAQAIQIHFAVGSVDSAYDFLGLFDSTYRVGFEITGDVYDMWSPVFAGDKVYLAFRNGIMSVRDYQGLDSTGAAIFSDWSKNMPNFTTEGVQIDRIRYVPSSEKKVNL